MGSQDLPEPPDPGAARNRRLIRGILTSFLSRGVAALVPLAMIPIMLPALGTSAYGAWMTVVSVTAMLVWADLGLGSGLLTRLSGHLARTDLSAARRDILTTYAIVALVGVLLGLASIVSTHALSWSQLLNASGSSDEEVAAIAVVTLVCFSCNMPLSLIQRVQYAAQQVGISNAFTALGPFISLALVLATTNSTRSAALIVLAASVGPLMSNLAATIWFFGRHTWLIPTPSDRRGANPSGLLSLGGLFVLISLLSSLAANSDSIIIARTLGSASVTDYSVAARIMGAMGLLINLVNLPYWPTTANALANREFVWVRRTTRQLAAISSSFVLVATVAVLAASEMLMSELSQGLVERDLLLIMCLGIWWGVIAFTSPMMMVQNATGVLAPQLLGWALFLAAALPLKILLIPRLGLFAGPLSGAIAYAAFVLPFAIQGYRRSLASHGDASESP